MQEVSSDFLEAAIYDQSIMPAFGHEAQAPAPQGLGAPEGAVLLERGAKVESSCSNWWP
jgi:hypothetical protein